MRPARSDPSGSIGGCRPRQRELKTTALVTRLGAGILQPAGATEDLA